MQVDRRVAQLFGQHISVVVTTRCPLRVILAQAVQHHQQLTRSVEQSLAEGSFFKQQGLAIAPQAHADA